MIPSIQKVLEENERKFNEEFGTSRHALDASSPEDVKAFLRQSNLELLAAVRAEIEGKNVSQIPGTYGDNDHLHIQHNIGWNAAITEILTALSEGKEEV